ncbi:Nck-associated protein 1 [Schistosoma japonicum]|nr:Nck-associated protein 1 [Schistosoma japonicum]
MSLIHQKLAERLFILNDRQLGVLTRIHYMKQMLNIPEYRPAVLPGGDKTFDAAWKVLLKKFPSIDIKSSQSNMQPFYNHQKELFAMLSTYYFNFVDVLDVKDHFIDLIGCLASSKITLDITINFDVTRLYLELVSNYFAMMFLITRIPDTKAILILFNFLYDQLHGKQEPNYPRMADIFTETSEGMLSRLHKEINPYSRTLSRALRSLNDFYNRRTVRAQNWNDGHFLDILHEPSKITHTVLGEQLGCELIPYEVMERWVVFGYFLIYPELTDEESFNRLKVALRHSYVVVLFREEVIYIHSLLQSFLESAWVNKIGAKRISEIKETFSIACSQTSKMHADRRAYLRLSLRQLHLILSDEPGLLGPKAFLVFWGLSYASDEVHWLLRHIANPIAKKSSTATSRVGPFTSDELNDPFLPELLFRMDELRSLVLRYSPVIQRFYLQLLGSYDGPGLNEYMQDILSRLNNEEAVIFTSVAKQLCDIADNPIVRETNLSPMQSTMFDFSGIRLDWLRLQACLSCEASVVNLSDYRRLVEHMNSTILHTKLVDYLDELLRLVSDMSIFIFYPNKFTELFSNCRICPAQLRFTIVFPSICSQAIQTCHDLCPEERSHIGRNAASMCRHFCQEIAENICLYLFNRIDEFGNMADQLAPRNAVPWLMDEKPTKKNKKPVISTRQNVNTITSAGGVDSRKTKRYNGLANIGTTNKLTSSNNMSIDSRFIPGIESFRNNREEQTVNDKTLFGLSQLCYSVNHHRELLVFDQVISPREILQNEIQLRIIDLLASYSSFTSHDNADESLASKPSELFRRVRALMNALIDLENHVCIDVIGLFSTVFTQHTQPVDAFRGQLTMTAHYAEWYLENVIKHAYMDHFVYSPLLKSFVTLVSPDVVRFRAEDYADLNELIALTELIGPLGIKFICDRLMHSVGDRVDEINKLVRQNRSTLECLRECINDPVRTRQLNGNLQHCDQLLILLKEIGVALAFRKLCFEAVHSVLQRHTPFLLDTVHNLRDYITQKPYNNNQLSSSQFTGSIAENNGKYETERIYAHFNEQLMLNNLCASVGISSDLDYNLCSILNNRRIAALATANQAGLNVTMNGNASYHELEYHIACLFVVFVANAFPRLARQDSSFYRIDLEANENNCHCIAYAVNTLMVSMFSLLRPGDLEARSKEFLALASSNLLRLGLETSSSLISSEIYGNSNNSTSTSSSHCLSAKYRDSIYIVFDNLIKQSPYLSASLQESCFPYSLIRNAYHSIAKMTNSNETTTLRSNVMSSSSTTHVDGKCRD